MNKNFERLSESQQDPESSSSRRDPEDRRVVNQDELKDKMLDKTLADSFPTSDPPSTIPNPGDDDLQTNATKYSREYPPAVGQQSRSIPEGLLEQVLAARRPRQSRNEMGTASCH